MELRADVAISVNGETIRRRIEARTLLADFVRSEAGLTGTHLGCEHGVCGACTVRLDGVIVRGCLTLAVQADGCKVDTIEGLSETGEIADLQRAFHERNAAQCGYCTPGMLMSAAALLAARPNADAAAIRDWIAGNYCRCTGYQAIVEAIAAVLDGRRAAGAVG